MTAAPSRIGILGVQHYHANFWARAFMQSDDAHLVGFWEPDGTLAAAFARTHGTHVFDERDDLVAQCDAVAICSATADHVALVRAAAQQGRAILCEKPLGRTAADCLEIKDIVERSGVAFMQSFPKRFDPVNHEILHLVRSEALGRITMCRIRHGHSHGLSSDFRNAWFVDPARSGGGSLLDEGIHAADFLRWLFGEPVSVVAMTSSEALELPVEDTAIATFRYRNGMIAEVSTSWCFTAADTSIEIFGTEGTILLGGVDLASRPTRETEFMRIFRREGQGGNWTSSATVPHFKTGVFHEHVAWTFVSALRHREPMPVTADDGLRAFAMIEAAYRSASSGRVETISYPTRTRR
jgi:predicted dehydrogenase